MGAQDWIDDVEEPDEEDESPSLFEENFEQMLDDDDIESLTLQTLEDQVDRIDSVELLEQAIEADSREGGPPIYEERIEEITEDENGTDDPDTESEEVEASDSDGDSVDEGDGGSDDAEQVDEDESDEADDEESVESPQEDVDEDESEEDADPPEASDGPEEATEDPSADSDDLPDVDASSLAPSAVTREEAADAEPRHTMLVWGPEGSGKSHVAHSAPEPVAYIDTEGKADELAEKFDKEILYWHAEDYQEAKNALDEALEYLGAYQEAGVTGTLVVDSMTRMWEYAKVDYAKFAYQTEDLSEVNFQSELEGEKDWTKIKGRHNDSFRQVILDSPFNVVFTAGQKEDYDAVFDGGGKKWIPDGEKWNKYAVKDVVRLRRDGSGRTVADLRKAAKTRYSFIGLEWPEWDDIYGAINQIFEGEQAEETIDLDDWEFDVVDGQPVENPSDGSDDEDDGGDEE